MKEFQPCCGWAAVPNPLLLLSSRAHTPQCCHRPAGLSSAGRLTRLADLAPNKLTWQWINFFQALLCTAYSTFLIRVKLYCSKLFLMWGKGQHRNSARWLYSNYLKNWNGWNVFGLNLFQIWLQLSSLNWNKQI